MAPKTFSLADLVPDRPRFQDKDGTWYEFAMPLDFDFTTEGRRLQLERRQVEISAALEVDRADLEANEGQMQILRELVGIFVPALPKASIAKYTMVEMMGVTHAWIQLCSPQLLSRIQAGPRAQVGPAK